MKKLTLLLVPVMPGFEAWAVNGFVEDPCDSDNSKNHPEPFDSKMLKKLTAGFTTPGSELLFVPFSELGSVISSLHERSLGVSVRPLDRGGIFVSGVFPSEKWEAFCKWLDADKPTNTMKIISK